MRLLVDTSWTKRGISILWGTVAVYEIVDSKQAISIHSFLQIRNWPDELPSRNKKALVVAGLDACLDILEPNDAESWIEETLRPQVLSFQDEYENQAALLFWIPAGKHRIQVNRADGCYLWKCAAPYSTQTISFGRCLWAGAESDVGRILTGDQTAADPDGNAWIGLHHPRIS